MLLQQRTLATKSIQGYPTRVFECLLMKCRSLFPKLQNYAWTHIYHDGFPAKTGSSVSGAFSKILSLQGHLLHPVHFGCFERRPSKQIMEDGAYGIHSPGSLSSGAMPKLVGALEDSMPRMTYIRGQPKVCGALNISERASRAYPSRERLNPR
jgi:hypothetical protein